MNGTLLILPTEKQLSPGLTAPVRTWWRFMTVICGALQVFPPFSQYPLLPGDSHWKPSKRCVHPHLFLFYYPSVSANCQKRRQGDINRCELWDVFFTRQLQSSIWTDLWLSNCIYSGFMWHLLKKKEYFWPISKWIRWPHKRYVFLWQDDTSHNDCRERLHIQLI